MEVSLLATCTEDDALVRQETLSLLSGGRYTLRDGGLHQTAELLELILIFSLGFTSRPVPPARASAIALSVLRNSSGINR